MNQKISKKITHKLEKLHQLLDKFEEVRNIDPDDPDTWDSDTLYNLVEDLQETLQLLEDQKDKKIDDQAEAIILESGLCSLIDDYHSEAETKDITMNHLFLPL